MKKKFTLILASMFLCMGTWAQQYEMPRLTADELNAVTEKLAIAIRCTQNSSSNKYYDGSGMSNGFTMDKVFYWTPVENGKSGSYYIMNQESQYLQETTGNNATDFFTFGEQSGAATLHAIKPTSDGNTSAYAFAELNLVWDKNADYIVRIALTDDSRWMNISKLSTTGTGIWTVQNVYDATNAQEILNNVQIRDWKAASLATIGYVGGYTESAREDINAVTTLDGIANFDESHEVLSISTDAYYRLICVAPKTGNSGETSYNTLTFNGNSNLVTAPTSNANINQIFKFEDAGDGKYYLKSLNANAYLNKISSGSYRAQVVAQENACKVELKSYGAAQWEVHNSEGEEKHSLFAENHPTETVPYGCSGWANGANSASAWYIVPATEVEVIINEFASICLPFAVAPGEGVKAYAIESTNSTYAILAEKADIPAGEGAILEGDGTVKLNLTTTATSNWENNMLEGTFVDTYVQGSAYVLAKKNDVIGLYKAELNKNEAGEDVSENGTHFKNNANKAYLVVAGAEAPMFSLDRGEGTTAIDNVELATGNVVIYDLAGRRVEKMEKGIYIVNGKKVIK